jgi:hypothetical protein
VRRDRWAVSVLPWPFRWSLVRAVGFCLGANFALFDPL